MTSEEVRAAAEFVQANEVSEKIPEKHSQIVTERGSTFSSVQRQLIAFAGTIATNPKFSSSTKAESSNAEHTRNYCHKKGSAISCICFKTLFWKMLSDERSACTSPWGRGKLFFCGHDGVPSKCHKLFTDILDVICRFF